MFFGSFPFGEDIPGHGRPRAPPKERNTTKFYELLEVDKGASIQGQAPAFTLSSMMLMFCNGAAAAVAPAALRLLVRMLRYSRVLLQRISSSSWGSKTGIDE